MTKILTTNDFSIFLFDARLYGKFKRNLLLEELRKVYPYEVNEGNFSSFCNGAGTLAIVYKKQKPVFSKDNVLSVFLCRKLCPNGEVIFRYGNCEEKYTFKKSRLISFSVSSLENERGGDGYYLNGKYHSLSEIKKHVYSSSTDTSNRSTRGFWIMGILSAILLVLLLLFINKEKIKMQNERNAAEKIELQKQKEKAQKLKLQKEKVLLLSEQYEKLSKNEFENPYVVLCELYRVMENGSKIVSIVIDGNDVVMEGTSNNAPMLLDALERNPYFHNSILKNNVKEKGHDNFNVECMYSKEIEKKNDFDSIEDQIQYLESEIKKLENKYIVFSNYSEIARYNRLLVSDSGCNEKSMTYTTDGIGIFLDFRCEGSNRSLMNYLKLCYKKHLKIRKIQMKDSILTVKIDSGLLVNSMEGDLDIDFREGEFQEISPALLSKLIKIKPVVVNQNKFVNPNPPAVEKKKEVAPVPPPVRKNVVPDRFEFIGMAVRNEKKHMVCKDKVTGDIANIEVDQSFVEDENFITFSYEGENYRVKK